MPTTKKSHLGIYALIEKEDSILLVKKSRGPYQGMWDLPGGSPNHGESIFQTLQREVMEETGIWLIDVEPFSNHAFLLEYTAGENVISFHHTALIYKALKFDPSQFQATICQEDVTGCAWIKKADLKNVLVSMVVLKALALSS